MAELSCHGGLYLLKRVLRAALEAGARPAGPGEFTRRAFVNGKIDLTRAEAVMDLIAADGRLEFKTDNQDLFTFSLEEIETSDRWHLNASTRDLHHDPSMNEGNIMTEYEEKFSSKGNPICKLIASR